MSKWSLFGFEREKILEYAESLGNLGEQVKYLQYVKQEYITKPPDLDPNYGIKPKLVKVINTQIEYIAGLIAEKKNLELKINKVTNKPESSEIQHLNNELSNAHMIIKKRGNRIKVLESGLSRESIYEMISKNNCLFKNGKINYTKLGKIMGCSHHTAKAKCSFFGVT